MQQYNRQNRNQDSALKYQLNSQRLINKIKQDLGMKKVLKEEDDEKWYEWELNEEKALLNREGINNLLALARSVIDKNTNLSEYKNKEIMRIMTHIHHTLRKNLVRNWHKYDISDNTIATEIMEIITNPIMSAYNRALEGSEKELLSQQIQSKEIIKGGNEKEDKGHWFSLGGN